MATTPMGPVDRAWLRMDDRRNPMVITAVLLFADGLPVDVLATLLRERLTHRRFRSVARAAGPLGAASAWDEVPGFDPASKVIRAALGPGEDALRALVAGWMGTPLDPRAPRWRVVHVDRGPAGVAVVVQVHHAIGDGVTLVRALLDVAGAGAPRPVAGATLPTGGGPLAALRRGAADAVAVARLLALPPEPRSPLRAPLRGAKVIAWTGPLSVAALERRARDHGAATLTDVVLAALTDALAAEHLRVAGAPLRRARALVPVFLHGADAGTANRFGLVFLDLPVGRSADRVPAVHAGLRTRRDGPDAEVALGVLGALGLSPRPVERLGVALFTSKASLLVTSVPGPKDPLTLGGRRVSGVIVSAPVAGTVGMSASILSVGDELRVSVATDRALPHDPARLVAAVERALVSPA